MKQLLLRVGDIGFLISWKRIKMIWAQDPCYHGFMVSKNLSAALTGLTHLVAVNVFPGCALPNPAEGELLAMEKNCWFLYKRSNDFLMIRVFPGEKKPNAYAVISRDMKKIDYYPQIMSCRSIRAFKMKDGHFFSLDYLISPFLLYVLLYLLAREGGFMLHGAGIKGKNGYVFSGPSGAGKTTIAKILRRHKNFKVLSDENLIIRKLRNRFYLYATPWPGGGRIAGFGKAELKSVFFIFHGRKNSIEKISTDEGYLRLAEQSACNLLAPGLNRRILITMRELCGRIDFFRLAFLKNKNIVQFLIEKGGVK